MYTAGNPVMLVDPDGMNDDDFYFDKKGKLIKYVENDQPDRVFVATGETKVEPNDPDLVPEPVYKQTNMSSNEVEKNMNNNGYKKVIKEETVIEETTHIFTSEPNMTETESSSSLILKIEDTKYKYVEKGKSVSKANSVVKDIIKVKHTHHSVIEKNRVVKTYEYGYKKDNTQKTDNVIIFIINLISAIF